MTSPRYVIDRPAVEADVARVRASLDQGYGRWLARQTLLNMTVFYVVVLALRWNELPTVETWPAWKIGLTFFAPVIVAVGLAWWTGRRTFAPDNLDVERRIVRISEDLRSLGGPGWVRRSLMVGVFIGLAIGIPIGTLMVLAWRPTDLPAASRWLAIPVFTLMTLLWSVPMSFLLRWMTLMALKRFVREVPE